MAIELHLWHDDSVLGVLRAAAVAVVILFGMTAADAQAYRPRGKTPSTKAAPGAKKAGAPAAAVSKTPTRATGATPRRVVTTHPAEEADAAPKAPKAKAKGKAKGKGKEDIVIVDDDDEDSGVTIKDD